MQVKKVCQIRSQVEERRQKKEGEKNLEIQIEKMRRHNEEVTGKEILKKEAQYKTMTHCHGGS